MEPFVRLKATAAPLPRRNINTDDIYPSLNGATITDPNAMGPKCFGNWRWNADGSPIPEFILNRPPYDKAQILVTGANYGCGSARESAVWCMVAIGLRCVIAPSFSDIFYGNALKNGLLPVRLEEGIVETLMAFVSKPESAVLDVDLEAQTVKDADGKTHAFAMGAYDRERLLAGLNDIGVTLRKIDKIHAFEAGYSARRPWLAAG
jgi:3-isopropylmalate/(R)-2-methylmalate dehydratase small subunit